VIATGLNSLIDIANVKRGRDRARDWNFEGKAAGIPVGFSGGQGRTSL
jgi:hypothetical protein